MTYPKLDHEIIYRRTFAWRLTSMLLAIFFYTGLPVLIILLTSQQTTPNPPLLYLTWFLFCVCEVIAIVIGTLGLYAAGPNDLYFNLTDRTYRHVTGWLFSPKVKIGSMDADISGVDAYCYTLNWAISARIVWKDDALPGQSRFYIVDTFKRSGRADRLAEEIASTLSLPLIKAP